MQLFAIQPVNHWTGPAWNNSGRMSWVNKNCGYACFINLNHLCKMTSVKKYAQSISYTKTETSTYLFTESILNLILNTTLVTFNL